MLVFSNAVGYIGSPAKDKRSVQSDFGSGVGWKDEAKGYLAGRKRIDRIAQRPITIG